MRNWIFKIKRSYLYAMSISINIDKQFESLFRLYYHKVKKFAVTYLLDDIDADEAAQAVFIKLWKNRNRLYNCDDLDTYIYVVSRNTIIDLLRKRKRSAAFLSMEEYEDNIYSETPPEADVFAKEISEYEALILAQMPPKRREVYTLHAKEGKTNEEIARIMGLSQRTVEKHLQLARQTIRDKLSIFLSS